MSRFSKLFTAPLLVALLFAALPFVACDDEMRRPADPAPIASQGAPPFHPPSYPAGRIIDSIASVYVDGGRAPLFVVGSRLDSARNPGRFDLIEIFGFDSTNGNWVRLVVDSIGCGSGLAFRDVTGDGRSDVILPMVSGGNDLVASNGLQVYSAHGGAFRRVFRSTWMNPRIDSLACARERVITVRRELWPLFAPRTDAVVYVDDIFGFRDGRFRSIAAEVPKCFKEQADLARAPYERFRDSIEALGIGIRPGERTGMYDSAGISPNVIDSTESDSTSYRRELHVFGSVAVVVLNLARSGDVRGARAFWSHERAFLRGVLRDEQFDELEAFCKPLIAAL